MAEKFSLFFAAITIVAVNVAPLAVVVLSLAITMSLFVVSFNDSMDKDKTTEWMVWAVLDYFFNTR